MTPFDYPGPDNAFPHPPGWTSPATSLPVTRVMLRGFECERFALSDFERPVRMLFESHDGGRGRPMACDSTSGVTIRNQFLASLWVDDAEIAAFLENTYGMPVYHSPITLERETLPMGHEYRLRWGEGTTESWFSAVSEGGSSPAGRINFRYYWYNGTVLGAMDFFHFSSTDMTGNDPTPGEMRPPMLMSRYSEQYASLGIWHPEARAEGNIELYKDPACEEPL